MATEVEPIVDHWYETIFEHRLLKVVSVDEERHLVEVQFDDGHLQDLSLQSWFNLDIDLLALPAADWDDEDYDREEEISVAEEILDWEEETN